MLPYSLLVQAASVQILKVGGLRINLWFWPFLFAFIKNMFLFMDIIIFAALVVLIYRFQSFRIMVYTAVEDAIESGRLSKDRMQRKWEENKANIESENMEDKKKAVIAAEGVLDNVLKTANFPGENLEMRLRKIPDNQLNFQEDIVWAFKFRERIESDSEFAPDSEEFQRAFYIFERALKELNVL
jgi:hypothetical protein